MTPAKIALPAVLVALFMSSAQARPGGDFDWSAWDTVLARYTKPATVDGVKIMAVDYAGLRAEKKLVSRLLEQLRRFDPAGLGRKQRMSFWINAYNLGAVKMVIDHPGIASINDAVPGKGKVWKTPILEIGGRDYSLNEIENSILRPLGDPRVHFAIVCASVSCPDLRRESYRAGRLDRQLDEQVRLMLKHPRKGLRIDEAGKKILVSRIFKWFTKDFGGSAGIRQFLSRYAKRLPRSFADFTIDYLDYDWKLNALAGRQ